MKFNLDKYDGEVNLEYFKEIHKLHNGYPFVLNKLEIKGEMLFDYQLKIADDDNISIGNVKKLVRNLFKKEKHKFHYKKLQLCLRLILKIKKQIVY